MDFCKTVIYLALAVLLVVNESTQFLVANCVWDDALSGALSHDLKGYVLSDADACALFCGSASGGTAASAAPQGGTSGGNAALCDRCCKSSQAPSKPGELLVTILHTLIKAFGPSKDSPPQTISTEPQTQGKPAGGNGAPSPAVPATQPPPAEPPKPEEPAPPLFDTGAAGSSGTVNFDDTRYRPAKMLDHFKIDGYQSGQSSQFGPVEPAASATPHQTRDYPEAEPRVYDIAGRSDGAFIDGFDRSSNRGPGWPKSYRAAR